MSLIERLIFELGPWSWWILGLILIGLEILAPGTFFLWFGVAAILVGTLALFVELSWQVSLLLFLAIAVASLVASRMFFRGIRADEGDPGLNRRGRRYVGRTFVLDEPIVDGYGRIHIDDTIWRVKGPDCGGGSKVRVTNTEGTVLVVEPADG